MDPHIDNPFRDIFDNVLDIFSSDYDQDFDSTPYSPPLAEEPSKSQTVLLGPQLVQLLPEAVYMSAIEAEEAIQSWAAQYYYTFFKYCLKLYNTTGQKKYI